jgi:hypothetical protein
MSLLCRVLELRPRLLQAVWPSSLAASASAVEVLLELEVAKRRLLTLTGRYVKLAVLML